MTMKKNIILTDGTKVSIEPVKGTEDIREFQNFINTLTKEGTYLLVERPVTVEQEKEWFQTQMQAVKKGEQIYLKAVVHGRLIGDCVAKPGFGRNHGNVTFGIAILRKWRRKGLGTFLLKEIITQSERTWHPRNIYLHVVVENKRAHHLYETLGFRVICRLPGWFEYHGRFIDEYILLLDKKQYRRFLKK
jgi:RimJ/RimL family protein N-acetyltransferase